MEAIPDVDSKEEDTLHASVSAVKRDAKELAKEAAEWKKAAEHLSNVQWYIGSCLVVARRMS